MKKKFAYVLVVAGITLALITIIILNINLRPVTPAPPQALSESEITQILNSKEMLRKGYLEYELRCSRCHGGNLDGGLSGPNLIDTEWIYGNSFNSIATIITVGNPKKNMPAWGASLFQKDIQAITAFILKSQQKKQSASNKATP